MIRGRFRLIQIDIPRCSSNHDHHIFLIIIIILILLTPNIIFNLLRKNRLQSFLIGCCEASPTFRLTLVFGFVMEKCAIGVVILMSG